MVKREWGRVVNLTSGIKETPQLAPYSVSKAAVDKYTKDLASQLKNTNVLVNGLDPGWIKTDLGGQNADHELETVLPGALVPALLKDKSGGGVIYKAQDYNRGHL
jgi:NAD(P)-dependent dehydrogenase (short-subunit alcohol dehydrogenase family)